MCIGNKWVKVVFLSPKNPSNHWENFFNYGHRNQINKRSIHLIYPKAYLGPCKKSMMFYSWILDRVLNKTQIPDRYLHWVKSARIRSYLWSVFSRIWTEYWDILRISPYSVRMRENTGQKNSQYGHSSLREVGDSVFQTCSKLTVWTHLRHWHWPRCLLRL